MNPSPTEPVPVPATERALDEALATIRRLQARLAEARAENDELRVRSAVDVEQIKCLRQDRDELRTLAQALLGIPEET